MVPFGRMYAVVSNIQSQHFSDNVLSSLSRHSFIVILSDDDDDGKQATTNIVLKTENDQGRRICSGKCSDLCEPQAEFDNDDDDDNGNEREQTFDEFNLHLRTLETSLLECAYGDVWFLESGFKIGYNLESLDFIKNIEIRISYQILLKSRKNLNLTGFLLF